MLVMGKPEDESSSDFGSRLEEAIEASGKSPTQVGRESKLSAYIFKLLGRGTAKQIASPGPEMIRTLADYLEVSYEWLAIGRGSMRPTGYGESAFEAAMTFALQHGARRDAVDAAAERFRDVEDMTGNDWILAINAEAQRLDRAGIPRPEAIEAKQRATRRVAAKKRRQEAQLDEVVVPPSRARTRKRAT